MNDINAIVIGVGRMGQRYLKILNDLSIKVLAFADCRAESLEQASLICPQAKKYTDSDILFSENQATLVVIASTAPSHHQLVLKATQSKAKFILCEKPMAVSIQQAEEMLQAAEKSGCKLAINHQMRFMPQYTRVKELLDSEQFSGLCSMNIIAGNFGLTMNGSHYIEAFRYMSGQEPVSVTAWLEDIGQPNPRGPQFKDVAGCLRITGEHGARFYLDCSANQGHGMRAIYASKYGLITVDEAFGQLSATYRQPADRELPSTRIVSSPLSINEQLQEAEVLDSTKAVILAVLNDQTYCTGKDGITIIRSLVAAYISSEQQNRTVALTEELPKQRFFSWA